MRWEIILLIVGIAFITFMTRFSFIVLLRNAAFSDRMVRWLKYIPIAILTTLIVPPVLAPNGRLYLSLHNDYLIAAIVACAIAYKTKNIIITIGVGMSIVLIFRVFLI